MFAVYLFLLVGFLCYEKTNCALNLTKIWFCEKHKVHKKMHQIDIPTKSKESAENPSLRKIDIT